MPKCSLVSALQFGARLLFEIYSLTPTVVFTFITELRVCIVQLCLINVMYFKNSYKFNCTRQIDANQIFCFGNNTKNLLSEQVIITITLILCSIKICDCIPFRKNHNQCLMEYVIKAIHIAYVCVQINSFDYRTCCK